MVTFSKITVNNDNITPVFFFCARTIKRIDRVGDKNSEGRTVKWSKYLMFRNIWSECTFQYYIIQEVIMTKTNLTIQRDLHVLGLSWKQILILWAIIINEGVRCYISLPAISYRQLLISNHLYLLKSVRHVLTSILHYP